MKRLRGPKGTTVNLTVVRRGIKDKLIFKVKRDKIPVTTMDAAYMIRPGIGYIRLGSFGLTSYKEVTTAMDSLKKVGMKDLIFDLEDNGGGYLQAAAQIANEFLQKGDLIVYTSGRAAPRQEYKAQANGRWRKGKVVVLTNEFTASAAEIVSGAIQDQDRGVVVGRRTFGKGLVQRPLTFDDGSEIRLTIAHYYTPSGRCIQKPYKKGAVTLALTLMMITGTERKLIIVYILGTQSVVDFLQLFLETARGIAETLEDTADARNIIILTMHTVFVF